jgi:FdhD protein
VPEDKGMACIECIRVNGEATRIKERVATETELSILINNKQFAVAMITPVLEKEFVVGHLFGQRVIDSISDISSITVENNIASVTLREIQHPESNLPVLRSDFWVQRQEIFEGVRSILKSKIFRETQAVHSAGLFKRGAEIICLAEDIGRHNALDKVIGYGLLNGIDFANTFAASTGRQPSEMVLRCGNANIPIIATKGVATIRAIEIAQKIGFTIVGLVRDGGMAVYSNPTRIK